MSDLLELFFRFVGCIGGELSKIPPTVGENYLDWAKRARAELVARGEKRSREVGDLVAYNLPKIDGIVVSYHETIVTDGFGIHVINLPKCACSKTEHLLFSLGFEEENDREVAECLRYAAWSRGVQDGMAQTWIAMACVLDPSRVEDFKACYEALNTVGEQIARDIAKSLGSPPGNWDD